MTKRISALTIPADTNARLLPDVRATVEFMSEANGVFGGTEQVLTRLRELAINVQVWGLETGAGLKRGDVAMRLRGAYRALGPQCNALAGILATTSGWTSAARALVQEANPAPVIFRGAANMHPALCGELEGAAVGGGCLGLDSEWNRGYLARDVILLHGDTVRALRAFDEQLSRGIPRLAPVDLFHEQADEAVRVALALGNALDGVVLAAQDADAVATRDTLQRVRTQLDLAGFPRVKIFLDGAMSAEFFQALRSARALVDGYFVGEQIGAAPPLSFAVELRECNDTPLARRGQAPGTTPSLRLKQIVL